MARQTSLRSEFQISERRCFKEKVDDFKIITSEINLCLPRGDGGRQRKKEGER